MLSLDEESFDLFDPQPGVTLQNVFTDALHIQESEKKFKYEPFNIMKTEIKEDKGEDLSLPSGEKSSGSECIFAKTVHVFELNDGIYVTRGRQGFALMKMPEIESTKAIIYDESKNNISVASLNNTFRITMHGNYINYYDDNLKYWSILMLSDDDHAELLQTLKQFDIRIESPASSKSCELNKTSEVQSNIKISAHPKYSQSKNRKKSTLINRIAQVGHSVLPLERSNIVPSSSSEEETNATGNSRTMRSVSRHKNHNELAIDPSDAEIITCNTTTKSINPQNIVRYVDHQIIPMPPVHKNDQIDYRGELNLFLSEHRASSSELRINVNRVADKIDNVMDKIRNLETKCNNESSNELSGVYQKLLMEYEEKIKFKDERIRTLLIEMEQLKQRYTNMYINQENEDYKSLIMELRNKLANKEIELDSLSRELHTIKERFSDLENSQVKINYGNDNLPIRALIYRNLNEVSDKNEILNLEIDADSKNVALINIDKKIKSIMNDVYHSIVDNFNGEESYSPDAIKKKIGAIIKKTTLESL